MSTTIDKATELNWLLSDMSANIQLINEVAKHEKISLNQMNIYLQEYVQKKQNENQMLINPTTYQNNKTINIFN